MYIYPWSMSFFWKIKPWLIILISPFFLWQGEWTWSNGKGMFSDLPCETLVGFCGGGGGSPKRGKIFIWLWSLVHTRPSSICQNYQLSVPTGLQHPAASAPCKKISPPPSLLRHLLSTFQDDGLSYSLNYLMGPKEQLNLLCPAFSCCKDENDDFHLLYRSKLKLKVNITFSNSSMFYQVILQSAWKKFALSLSMSEISCFLTLLPTCQQLLLLLLFFGKLVVEKGFVIVIF